jgi:hypothetical protein
MSSFDVASRPLDFVEPAGSGRGMPVQSREVGVLWSNRADIIEAQEVVEFEGVLIAEAKREDQSGATWLELFQRGPDEFFVYQQTNHRTDWFDATLHGAPNFAEPGNPLTLEEIQERFPDLASRAGLARVRRI